MVCNASSWLISEGMHTQYVVIFIRYECKEGAVVKLAFDLSWKYLFLMSAYMPTVFTLHHVEY